MNKSGIFVTGTDTGIGKTVVSSLLLASLKTRGIYSGYFKPVQTGSDLDTPSVAHWTGGALSEFPQPTYQFKLPAAPFLAAEEEGCVIHLDTLVKDWMQLENRVWVVEGAGGLLVPLTPELTIRDLILALGLKLLVVASTRLGTMNHTLLTLEAARNVGISIAGIILNGPEDRGLRRVLEEMSRTSLILQVDPIDSLTPSTVQTAGREVFSYEILRSIFDESVLKKSC